MERGRKGATYNMNRRTEFIEPFLERRPRLGSVVRYEHHFLIYLNSSALIHLPQVRSRYSLPNPGGLKRETEELELTPPPQKIQHLRYTLNEMISPPKHPIAVK